MRITAALAIAASALTVGHAGADQPAPHTLRSIYRFETPPAGFRAASASDATLARYGLPSRPSLLATGTHSYATWARAMTAARTYIAPIVRANHRQHRPATRLRRLTASSLTSGNWAGQALENATTAYSAGSYTEVMGQWVISGVQQPVGTCGGTDVSATWVGIDGLNGSGGVLQAGTEADAFCTAGHTSQNDYAWYEWFPADEYQLVNFPIVVGGSIFVVVQATSATSANATFVNLQTGTYTVIGFGAPNGTQLRGNSAEWVVERPSPSNSNTPGTLADFGEIPMESEIAYLASQINTASFNVPGIPGPGQTSDTLTMTNDSNAELAGTVVQGNSAQLMQIASPTE